MAHQSMFSLYMNNEQARICYQTYCKFESAEVPPSLAQSGGKY